MRLTVSIGVMAFNEGKNIGKLLDLLLKQKLNKVSISEIIVVSSGSTDRTNQIVRSFKEKKRLIKFIIEKKRKGKAAAVNVFLQMAKAKIIILMSADLLLNDDTIENLILPLRNSKVGIVGSHPIPTNDPKSFWGFAAHLLWKLHHQISLTSPKMGEVIAFRKVFHKIPVLSAVDEANIEPLIRGQGYKAVYAPNAVVYNKGPEAIKEFVNCRRRIYFGHLATKYEYSYEVSTLQGWRIFPLIFKNVERSWRFFLYTPAVIALEVFSRFLGFLDYKLKLKSYTVWQIAKSTKNVQTAQSIYYHS